MATLSLREAAEQTGVSKSTIFRAIKSGRMSAPRNDDGEFLIDPAELHRVYPIKPATPSIEGIAGDVPAQAETSPAGRDAPDHDTVELRIRNAALEAELRGLREMAEELRRARDQWQQQAERAALSLAAPKPIELIIPAPAPVAQRAWWPFRRAG